jgi:DNA processing protein
VNLAYEVWERGDPRYPTLLAGYDRAPDRLFAAGRAAVLDRVAIAVVGARRASPASLGIARRIGQALAEAGACVVSGLAVGVDAAAHAGALEVSEGRTCAVLGGGLEVGAPASNRGLQARIAARGLLLSAWEPSFPPATWTFPRRNGIIAAMCRATVVVEASATSGALITAAVAADLDRVVAAVPGPIDGERHLGSNRLLQLPGTHAIAAVADVLDLLGPRAVVTSPPPQFNADEGKVWDALADGPLDVDRIAIRAHLPTTRCLAAITSLELADAVCCELTGEVRRR